MMLLLWQRKWQHRQHCIWYDKLLEFLFKAVDADPETAADITFCPDPSCAQLPFVHDGRAQAELQGNTGYTRHAF